MRRLLERHPRHVGLAALIVGLLASGSLEAAALLAGGAFGAVASLGRRPWVAAVAASLLLGGAVIGAERREAIDRTTLRSWAGHELRAFGYVVRRERVVRGEARARVRLTSIGGPSGPSSVVSETVQVRGRSKALRAASIGDELELEGQLELPRSRPGDEFDYSAYLRRSGVHAVLRLGAARATERRRGGLPSLVDALRRRSEVGVSASLDPLPAALARGIVLGQDELIPARVSDQFKDSGLAHLLAVSGQNVTLLAVLALPLLAAMGLGRRGRLLAVLALIALYVPLTGAGPSIMRAGAMGAAGTVAALAGRPASRWYALMLAAAFTLAFDPRAWLDPGWQLSFAAVIGIAALSQPLTRRLGRLPEPLAAGFAVTAAATLATAPLIAYQFGRVSLVSLAANVAVLPAVAPLMWLGMLAAAVGQVSIEAAALLNGLNAYCVSYLAAVARWSASLPHAAVDLEIGIAELFATYAALALALGAPVALARLPARARVRARAGGAALAGAALAFAAATLLASVSAPRPPDRFTVTFLDVGQGDATLIQAPGDVAVLIDGGPPEAGVTRKLRSLGVRSLDLVVLTHAQLDHQGGLEDAIASLEVDLLLDGGGSAGDALHRRILSLARARGVGVVAARAGQVMRAGGLRLRVLSPEQPPVDREEDPNRAAIVLLASYRGFDVFLPADAESDVTLGLPLRAVEVLKVAHHGSADEGLPALLDRLKPRMAVIEVGEGNRYGHPHPQTLGTLEAHVPNVRRTDRDGSVSVSFHERPRKPGPSGVRMRP